MRFKTICVALAAPFALAGCNASGGLESLFADPLDTAEAFSTIGITGRVDTSDLEILPNCASTICNKRVVDSSGNGYFISVAYDRAGFTGQRRLVAQSQLISDNGVFASQMVNSSPSFGGSTAGLTGSATYSGAYSVSHYSDVSAAAGSGGATIQNANGTMSLAVNFGTGSILGTSGDGRLFINGNISSDATSMTGVSSFDGVSGDLQGPIGGQKLIGAVAGNNASGAYAGGVIATR